MYCAYTNYRFIDIERFVISSYILYMDFVGPFPTGENLLVLVDYYSRYPEVEIMKNITIQVKPWSHALWRTTQKPFAATGFLT